MSAHETPPGEVERLVRGVAPGGDITREQVDHLFATAAWSVIAEPGDGTAGQLVAVLGAERALALVRERRSPAVILTALTRAEAGGPIAVAGSSVTSASRSLGESASAEMRSLTESFLPTGSTGTTAAIPIEMFGGAETLAGVEMLAEADPRAPGVGDALTEAAGLTVREVAAALERWMPRLSFALVLDSLRAAAACSARLLSPADEWCWPVGFTDLGPFAPIALWVRGDPARLAANESAIALVGSRDATNYGEHVAMSLASGLCDAEVSVVSGAAYGIDGMAHRAALAAGGTTVAYLAGGVDRLYPAAHHDLLRRVIAHGVVVSEVPCGTPPTRWRFLQRNRLIAAGSDATVVVEAGHRSGSLNTAGHAAALGRPLGAVPGPVTSSTSVGCHRLMREYDARCVTGAADALELVRGFDPGPSAPLPGARAGSSKADAASLRSTVSAGRSGGAESGDVPRASGSRAAQRDNPDVRRVRDALSVRSARGVQQLARSTGLAPRSVAAALGALALDGRATESEAGWRSC